MKKIIISLITCFTLTACVSMEEREQRREARKLELRSIEERIPGLAVEFEKACVPYLNGTPVDDVIKNLVSEQYESVAMLQANFTQKFRVLQHSDKQIQVQLQFNSKSVKQCNVILYSDDPDLQLVPGGDRHIRDKARETLREVATQFAASRGKKLKRDGNKFHIGFLIAPEFQFHVPTSSASLGIVAAHYIYGETS